MAMNERSSAHWTVDNLLRPVMISAMLACLITPLVYTVQGLDLTYNGSHFIIFAFLASLEGILSERVLQRRRIGSWAYLGSRLAEAALLLLLLKFSTYLYLGFDQLQSDAQLWLSEPVSLISDSDLYMSLLFLVMWVGALYVARKAMELDVVEEKAPPPDDRTSAQYYLWLTKPTVVRDRQKSLDELSEIILWGGVALLATSALVHVFVRSARALAVPMLLYFALGVALLAQARFSVAHMGWRTQGIDVQPQIARRWLVWVVVFLVGVSLVALLLPTYYTLGPLQAFLGALSILYAVLSFIVGLLFFLLALPLALLLPDVETPTPPALAPKSLFPPGVTADSAGSPWLQVLGSAIFWIILLAIVGYALFRFWRDRMGQPEDGEPAGSWLARLGSWLRAVWERWWAWRRQVQDQLAARRARRKVERPLPPRLLRLFFPGRLPPRELVRFFYLSAARRAEQAGHPRRSGQTPYEYRESLDERFPELEPDLGGLTDAFVRARYSSQPVEPEQATAVKPLWERVKAALRRRRL